MRRTKSQPELLTSEDRGKLAIGTGPHLSPRPVERFPAARHTVFAWKLASALRSSPPPFP